MNQMTTCIFLILLICTSSCKKEEIINFVEPTSYESNENGTYQDFLTPQYYNINETGLRDKINRFIYYIRLEEYQHPLQNSDGIITTHSINREFGTGIGMNGTTQHHPAIDLHPFNSSNTTYTCFSRRNCKHIQRQFQIQTLFDYY